jgi:hypothetical protein
MKDWDEYIQPVLFAYRIKQLRITGYSPYKLVYGKEPSLAMDKPSKGRTLVERLIEIIDKVPQLRGDAKKTIKQAQEKLEASFTGINRNFKKGELVLYYDKAKAGRHDAKLEYKWKGPYQISKVLDKGAYRLSVDGKELGTTVNENLLKSFYGKSSWIPVIIV